jgi:hypothetical protein
MDWLNRVGARGLLVSCVLSAGCADDAPATKGASAGVFGDGDGSDAGSWGNSDGDHAGDGDGDGDAPLPAEIEEMLSFDLPQAGKTSVYVPNPVTNRVAVVNAETFAIETVAAGTGPTYAATVPGQDVAVIINVGSKDASLLRTVDGHTKAIPLQLGHDANAIAVSPSGKHAVLYFDASASKNLASSFQDVTVVDLTEGSEHARGVSVGFRPRSVQFSDDGRAFVNTEDGISIVKLAAAVDEPTIADLVSVGDTLADALSEDVQITPDGHYAIARRAGSSVIRQVELATGLIASFDLKSVQLAATKPVAHDAGVPDGGQNEPDGVVGGMLSAGPLDLSDMDLAPDGKFLLAVERRRGALLKIPVPSGFANPAEITIREIDEQLVGQVSIAKKGNVAVLYTTVNNTEGVVFVDLTDDGGTRGVRLRKGVRAVAFSDNGERAVVLHTKVGQANANASEEARIDASEGYSLIDTKSGFAKLQLTSAAMRQRDILVLDGPGKLFALLRSDSQGVRSLEMADLNSFQVTSLTLARPPSSIGLVPGLNRIFIGQDNPGGMITFVNSDSGAVAKAVSGFELASRIRQ